jgi:hypothetical protein
MRQSVELVVAELGEKTREDYVAMTQGKLIEPPENSFGPCLRPVPPRYRDFELGFDEMRLGVVSDLESASAAAAAAAGVKEGDIIHTHTPLAEVRSSPDAELTLELERDSERLTISYVPRGEPVDGWAWERDGYSGTGVPALILDLNYSPVRKLDNSTDLWPLLKAEPRWAAVPHVPPESDRSDGQAFP